MDASFKDLSNDFIQLARTALTGRQQDVQLLIHRASKKFKSVNPDLTDALIALLKESPTRTTPLRKHAETPLPVDLDSRLQLLRLESSAPDHEPILAERIQAGLSQVVSERKNTTALLKHGLAPTKSVLFNGPPGVGKTMAAKWIAAKLNKPLLILDLAAVMSSFLGRTGNNIRFVLDYAKNTDCVLLLDELDAIAKRRDDSTEIGELKRLVTVLLQEIDDWPASGLLIAATNHPDLLDPAVWRRFEMVLNFTNPTTAQIEQQVDSLLCGHLEQTGEWSKILSYVFAGASFSEIERQINQLRKAAAIEDASLDTKLEQLVTLGSDMTKEQKIDLARALYDSGVVSQRRAQQLTGVARETIRKNVKKIKI
ncbi:AAA family ATPase [Mucilaginibacter rubeus]|uniref:AAA family ATPase n=1 Tax=Mucilaginibacter rubeus TaxID=2027860 RepID=A0AAE6JDP5_9SPHI|nr:MULTISPECIES: ATP-binding protein [Mucilaginibacter]QEM03656.1 AAA family ATPase [Mucilaginibacter rubeus]QEM16267.1 AAA family ATPase [Mucilaginibacter gossypii]QTE40972.1 AAA family ATPase [Mucilaginibacter rubeus]QTE47575.1 AAA family ATPase [Mucilaginibacter rubeus]QTE58966.1 AAA family ATPase [Mucilaginibacter rubeus]